MFLLSICRGKSDLGLCMISVPEKRMALRMRPHSADFWFKKVFGRKIRRKPALTLLELHYILQVFCVRQKDGGGVKRGS